MTANRRSPHRPADPPGVTYTGGDGMYTIRLHGKPIGAVYNRHGKRGPWIAHNGNGTWTAGTRREAVEGLVAWLEEDK